MESLVKYAQAFSSPSSGDKLLAKVVMDVFNFLNNCSRLLLAEISC